jgi:hypothetical protein
MERDIADTVCVALGDRLVSLLVMGSYATYDIVEGYSDYDLLALVEGVVPTDSRLDLHKLSDRYRIDIGCVVRPIGDVRSRIDMNDQATRYIGNLELLDLKLHARLLYGTDIAAMIPDVKTLLQRDIGLELRAQYLHAVDSDPVRNIFRREPRNWCNYIINLCGALLLGEGIAAEKRSYPALMRSLHPDFRAVPLLENALRLRETKKALRMSIPERARLRESLALFLEEYRRYTFH